MSYLIVNKIDEDACLDFLSKYGRNGLTESMLKFINQDGDDLHIKFVDWVNWKNDNKINFGGVEKHIDSNYGSKTFFIYEWGNVDAWSEIFEYLYHSQNG